MKQKKKPSRDRDEQGNGMDDDTNNFGGYEQ